MANTERIETLISKEALAQFAQLQELADANVAAFEKLIAKGVEVNKTIGGAKTFKDITTGMREMEASEKALTKQADDLAKAQKKLDDSYSAQARKLAEIKEQQNLVNQANKQSAKEALGLVDAYDRLTKEYNAAAKEARNLSIQFGANSKEAKEASARALELDQRLKSADANVGRFNKNVGNYSGAIKILDKSLNDVKQRIEQVTKAGSENGAVIIQLRKEEELLTKLVNSQVTGFASASAELKANTQALQQMAAQGLASTDAYRELFKATAELKDETADLKTALTNAAPDDVAFNAAADAARGLIGVYGLAKSASAVFGAENEALNETLVKLQAAETALQSIEAIRALFKKENAVLQVREIALQKISLLSKNLETAAESKNIIVKYAAVAAQKALNVAMSLAGGPLLAIVGGLALLLVALSSFSSAAKQASLDFNKLNAEFDQGKRVLDDYIESVKRSGDETVAALQSQFADEKTIRKQQTQNLRDQLKATIETENERRDQAAQTQKFLEDLAKKSLTTELSEKEQDEIEKAEEFLNKQRGLTQQRLNLASQLRIQITNNEKTTTEELIKARQSNIEAEKIQLQTAANNQSAIAGNEKKSFDERIAALKRFGELQVQIINADAAKQKLTPGQTPEELRLIETQRANAVINARRESTKAITDLTFAENEKIRRANLEILKIGLDDQIKANEKIVENDKKGYSERLDAAYAAFTRRRSIRIAEHEEELKDQTLNTEQRKALEKKYASDIEQLTTDYLAVQLQLVQDNQEQQTAAIEKEQQKRLDIIGKEASIGIIGLNAALKEGNISITKYAAERAKIESNQRILSLKEEQAKQTGLVLSTKKGTAEREAAENALAAATLAISDELAGKRIANEQKVADARRELANEGIELLSTIILAQYERQKQAIDGQIDALERQKQKDIEVANQTITNEQEKAAAIATIEARANAQKEQLEIRKKRIEYERARTERAITIARIIADTAAAVVAALGSKPYSPANIALAAVTGAIGAAQIAKVAATPLPQFEHGTMDAPGGPSLVGEKRPELIVTPEGKMIPTPGVPTVMNVPKHSIVFPDLRAIMEGGLAVNKFGQLVEQKAAGDSRVAQKIDKLTAVIRNKPVVNLSADQGGLAAMWQWGANTMNYVEDQTKF